MSGQHRRARYEIRHLSSTLAPVKVKPTVGVQELIVQLEDIFPTQRIQMPTRETQPLRGQW